MNATHMLFPILALGCIASASAAPTVRENGTVDGPVGPATRSSLVKAGEVPPGLNAREWSGIQAQIEQSRYRLEPSKQSVSGANPEQGWTLQFDRQGLSLDPANRSVRTAHEKSSSEHGRWHGPFPSTSSPVVGAGHARESLQPGATTEPARTEPAAVRSFKLRTTAIGRADALTPVTGATPVVRDNRVELHHAQATEWYLNSAAGLEHGYTFNQPPQGERHQVHIQLAVDGGLKARPDADGVLLTDATGTQRLRYHKLLVVDANDRKLDTRLEVQAGNRLLIAFDDTHATYPVVVDPLLVNEEAKLTVTGDGSFGEQLGYSIAVDGNTMLVGRPEIGNNGQGSAYVFVRSGTTWTQQAKLSASDDDGAAFDRFGLSVAVSGDTAVVGADGDNNPAVDQGSAYVFVRSGTTWTQQAKLSASDGAQSDFFGTSVSVSGDTAVVGAPSDDSPNVGQGSAYVFVRSGGSWTEQTKLSAGDGAGDDSFGRSVSVSGDTSVIGAPGDDNPGNFQGSAYVFVRSGTIWVQQAKLSADDGAAGDQFGISVALSGDTAVVGAHLTDRIEANPDEIPNLIDRGSAYVFVRSGSSWTQQAKLGPTGGASNNGSSNDEFGISVAVSANAVVVGAHREDFGGFSTGSVYVFVRSGSTWTRQAKLGASDASESDFFGSSVAVSGDTAVVGTQGDDIAGNNDQGSAYVFVRSGSSWTQQAKLITSDGAGFSLLGFSVALSGDTALVGAKGAGLAYVFVRSGSSWSEQARLNADDGVAGDAFGHSVALSGDTAVVGAVGDNSGQGSAYIFVRSGNNWTQQARLSAGDGAVGDFFGISVVLSGDTAVVGAYGDDNPGSDQGSAYVFLRSGATWTQQAKLSAGDGAPEDEFGVSVALSGDTAVVGANGDDNPGVDQGSAYVFVRTGSSWMQQVKLSASDGAESDFFGISVALSGETAVVGAAGDNSFQGSAYVFVRGGSSWTEQARLSAGDGATLDLFGISAGVFGDTAVVGAHFDDNPGSDQGSAYVFVRNGTGWSQQAKLSASDGAADDNFGFSVALSGDTAVIGAHFDDNPSGGNAGAAYVYRVAADYGDAPDPTYPTLLTHEGARHFLNGPRLGTLIDAELDGQPNSGATGDDIAGVDDEDGVEFGTLVRGQSATANVEVAGGPALLDAWVDFNRDGDWADAGEQIFDDYIVLDGANDGLVFSVPGTAVSGISYARVRLSSDGVASFTGPAVDGEVEDDMVTIQNPADTTPDDFTFTDVTGVALSTVQISTAVTIVGIDAATPISVSGGTYSIGCTEAFFTAAAGTIANNQSVCVRHTSSPGFVTTVDTTLTIGSVSDTFTSTTVTANKRATSITAKPALASVLSGSLLRLNVRFEAQLQSSASVAGKPVVFTAAAGTCTATTNASGVATCSLTILRLLAATLNFGYTASFAGDAMFLPSSVRAPALQTLGIPLF